MLLELREHQLRDCFHQTGLCVCLSGTFLINDWCERAQTKIIVGGTIPNLVVLGSVGKGSHGASHGEQASKQLPPWTLLVPISSPFDDELCDLYENKPFLPQVAFGQCLSWSNLLNPCFYF